MSLPWIKAITDLRLRWDFGALNLEKRRLKILCRKSTLDLILEILSSHSVTSDQIILSGQKRKSTTGFENLKSLSCLWDISWLWWWKGCHIHLFQPWVLEAKGASFQTYAPLGWEEWKVSFVLKDRTIGAEAQYTALFASSTFPVAASFWQGWGLPFERNLVGSHFIVQQRSRTKWYPVH